eukprot:16445595-Heterocapsa_arctica.AAC.1
MGTPAPCMSREAACNALLARPLRRPGQAREEFVNFTNKYVLREDAAGPVYEDEKVIRPYWDPILGTDQ